MKNEKSVFGLLNSKAEVEVAVELLRKADFRPSDISVLMPDMGDTQSFAHEKETKAPEGTATGAATGAVAGSGLGWLAGIGALAIPGIGPFVAAGPIVAAVGGAGVGGAVGGLTGGLVGLGVPEYVAKRYESFLKDDGILISVHTDDSKWRDKAKDILESAGANDISSTDEAKAPTSDRKSDDAPPISHHF